MQAALAHTVLLVCDAPQSVSSPWGWDRVSELPFRRETIPTLSCCLPLPSSPSTFSCTAAFWTRSWRNLSWIYQGRRGKALLCFATLPSQQALAPGQKAREAQAAIPPGAGSGVSPGGCSLQHGEPSTEQSAVSWVHQPEICRAVLGKAFPQPLPSQSTGTPQRYAQTGEAPGSWVILGCPS